MEAIDSGQSDGKQDNCAEYREHETFKVGGETGTLCNLIRDEVVPETSEVVTAILETNEPPLNDSATNNSHDLNSRRSKSRNRHYRNQSNNVLSEEEACNDAAAADDVFVEKVEQAGSSRPRSRSVEGKRSAIEDAEFPLAKYRRHQAGEDGEGIDQEVPDDSDDDSRLVQQEIISPTQELSSNDPESSDDDNEDIGEPFNESEDNDDREMQLESSSDSDMFYVDTTSSSSSQESLPDLEDRQADNSRVVPTVDGTGKMDSSTKVAKKETDPLPSPLGKPKPKETWNGPMALIQREIGHGSGRYSGRKQAQSEPNFRAEFYGSLFSAERLELMLKLDGHKGCVNCLNFNHCGTKLASGSDDLEIKIWNYTLGKCITSFPSGHRANVFQVKFIPFLGTDTMIVSSSRDNQVRLNELSSSGEVRSSRKLAQHRGPCHKLSTSPDHPNIILSCGEDSFVFSIDTRVEKPNRILSVREGAKKVSLYSLHQNPCQPHEFCVSGKDSFVRVFDIRNLPCVSSPFNEAEGGASVADDGEVDFRRNPFAPVKKFCPHHLAGRDEPYAKTNITAAVYNHNGSEILASYNDEHIYLFDSSHSDGADFIKKYEGHRNNMTVKGVNFYGDKSEFVVSGSDCGNIFLWEKNTESIVNFFRGDEKGVVNCLEGHPTVPILATSGLDDDIKIWVPSHESPPKMSDLLSTVKRNKRKREAASEEHSSASDGFMMWALRTQLQSLRRNRRGTPRGEDENDSDLEDWDGDEHDEDGDDDEEEELGLDCVVI